MPNWCANELTITGPEDDIKKFKELVSTSDSDFSFDAVIPMPDGEWDYDWCNSNWGVKWDLPNDMYLDDGNDDMLMYSFDTAWGPPYGIYTKLTEIFPDITISWFWHEPGMEATGYLNVDDGAKRMMESQQLWGVVDTIPFSPGIKDGNFKLTVTDPPASINAKLVISDDGVATVE